MFQRLFHDRKIIIPAYSALTVAYWYGCVKMGYIDPKYIIPR